MTISLDFFTTPTGIAVIAAGSSFIAGLLGTSISTWTTRSVHSERLAFDQQKFAADIQLAERKFVLEKELAERKATADIALAERKFALDAKQGDRKRRQELAEELLESFYKMRDVIQAVRVPISFQDEAASRPQTGYEPEEVARQKNTYYAPLARMDAHRGDIAAFLAKRYRAAAWFGAAVRRLSRIRGALCPAPTKNSGVRWKVTFGRAW